MEGFELVLDDISIETSDLRIEYIEFKRSILKPIGIKKNIIALNDINFKVKNGEIVALIGKNGAGKSTLLNAIAGNVRPNDGQIITMGRVILLAGVNAGFDADITGRQNILELSKAYGIPNDKIEEVLNSVLEFSELGDAIDRNYRGYSTGMKGKLGFGFITSLNPEILLIDETLGVGDTRFRAKAQERLRKFIQRSNTVLISTHSLGLAKEICTRGLVLDEGKLIFDGEINEAVATYVKNSE